MKKFNCQQFYSCHVSDLFDAGKYGHMKIKSCQIEKITCNQ